MLDITDPNLYQIFFSIEIQLILFVIVVLFSALMVFKICKMDLLRVSQQKQHFYQNFDNNLHLNDQFKLLQSTTALHSVTSASSNESSVEESIKSPPDSFIGATNNIANNFINQQPHRTCEMCKKYEKTLRAARISLETTGKRKAEWLVSEAKLTLSKYETFIERVMIDYDKMKQDKEIITVHVNNLNRAFENLQEKYTKAKDTIAGYERNEKLLLTQLSKYETMFQMIQERAQLFQENQIQNEPLASSSSKSGGDQLSRPASDTMLPTQKVNGRNRIDKQITTTTTRFE